MQPPIQADLALEQRSVQGTIGKDRVHSEILSGVLPASVRFGFEPLNHPYMMSWHRRAGLSGWHPSNGGVPGMNGKVRVHSANDAVLCMEGECFL